MFQNIMARIVFFFFFFILNILNDSSFWEKKAVLAHRFYPKTTNKQNWKSIFDRVITQKRQLWNFYTTWFICIFINDWKKALP